MRPAAIPYLLSLYNENVYTFGGFIAPMALSALPADKLPSACMQCRSFEKVCPQQIRISEKLADFSKETLNIAPPRSGEHKT